MLLLVKAFGKQDENKPRDGDANVEVELAEEVELTKEVELTEEVLANRGTEARDRNGVQNTDSSDVAEAMEEAGEEAGEEEVERGSGMHNRVRMIVASFLVKDMEWQHGARSGSGRDSGSGSARRKLMLTFLLCCSSFCSSFLLFFSFRLSIFLARFKALASFCSGVLLFVVPSSIKSKL